MNARAAFVLVLLVALAGRVLLLASGSVSFHSDEAIVGLMARHILQGERPVFFYGQAYMGSLDAWLTALGFVALGQSVLTIRIVQAILYLLVVATSFALVWRISGRVIVTVAATLVIAVPNTLLALYTTVTLGGYNETLLLGNGILLLAWDVTHEHRNSRWRWGALGLCAGVGWWVNGLIIAFILPASALILWEMWNNAGAGLKPTSTVIKSYMLPILLSLAGFLVGSAPWWAFNFANNFAALRFFLPSDTPGDFAGTGIPPLPLEQRLIGLFLLGLPTAVGLRFPWEAGFFLLPVGALVLLLYGAALVRLLRSGEAHLKPGGRLLVLSMIGLFCALFFLSRFSIDPSGRYFVPLLLPLGIAFGTLVAALRQTWLRAALVGLVIGYGLVGVVVAAANNPPGITTQFVAETHLPNDDDAALIAFLDEHQLFYGYTNYWISFRIAFLSGERMQYSAALPEKTDLSYTSFFNRYPPYVAATENAPPEQVAYVTANVLAVKDALEAAFAAQGVTYQYAQVGIYHIYYDFAPSVPLPQTLPALFMK